MLRALPKSQQARWLEIGRAFERVRRPARPGEHVAFTPVAEAGAAWTIPTRFPARTARIPSGLRPSLADAAASPPEAREAPDPLATAEVPSAAEETPAVSTPAAEPMAAAPASEAAARAEPAIAVATETPTLTAETLPARPAPEPAHSFSEEFLPRRRLASATEWGGWSSFAARKDLVLGDEAAAEGHVAATSTEAPPPATAANPSASPTRTADSAPPPLAPASEHRAGDEPRVSAIEYFRAAPW